MELHFASAELQRLAESRQQSDEVFGPDRGAMLRQRLSELAAAETLAIVETLPTLAIRHGTHNRCSAHIARGLRLAFMCLQPAGSDGARAEPAQIVAIRITGIEEEDGV
jgi:hypothetical protein